MREIADAILLEVAYQHWNVWREYLSARRTDFTPPGREGFLIDQAKQSGIPDRYGSMSPLSPHTRDRLLKARVFANPSIDILADVRARHAHRGAS